MAVLFQEELDNKSVAMQDAEERKRNALIERAYNLKAQVLEKSSTLQDLLDTAIYIEQRGIADIRRSGVCARNIFEQSCNEISFGWYGKINNAEFVIDYKKYLDYQHLTFHQNGSFTISCVDRFNGYQQHVALTGVCFEQHNNYYIDGCIDIMQKFLADFDRFHDAVMSWVKSKIGRK